MPRKKKQDITELEKVSVSDKIKKSKKATSIKEPVPSKEKKVDGRSVEGRLEKVKQDYSETCKHLAELKSEYNTLLGYVKTLEVLLASFNAMTRNGDVKLVKPDKGTSYWYIRAMPTIMSFEVIAWQWNDWQSDHYRYVIGNMFLDQSTAVRACQALNAMLQEL